MGCTVLTSCVGWAADGEMKGQDVVLGKLLRKSKNSEGGDEGGEGEKRPTGRLSCVRCGNCLFRSAYVLFRALCASNCR